MLQAVRKVAVVAVVSSAAWLTAGLAPANAFAVTAPTGRIGGYQVVENAVSLPAGGFVRTTAQCPAGTVVLGGGAAVVGAGSANFRTELQESEPGSLGGGTSLWLASVSNHSANNYTLGIFAVCAAKPRGYRVVERAVSLRARGFRRLPALCPIGKVVLGGGAAIVGAGSANFGTELQESEPGTTGGGARSLWLSAVSNHSANSYTLGLFAVCAT